jgi:hypothetical protein
LQDHIISRLFNDALSSPDGTATHVMINECDNGTIVNEVIMAEFKIYLQLLKGTIVNQSG